MEVHGSGHSRGYPVGQLYRLATEAVNAEEARVIANNSSPSAHTIRRAQEIIEAIGLDLGGLCVYTEAATGGYCVTPVLAALSGAYRVFALARDSRFGTAAQAFAATRSFAELAGVCERVLFVTDKRPSDLAEVDIVTNSGHVRPIDAETVGWLKPTAVVPLMYESWEWRPQDVDLGACRVSGIAVAGTDETHPLVGITDYLGMMAVKLLLDGGIEVIGTRLLIWSDNKFGPYIASTLAFVGAEVSLVCPPELWQAIGDAGRCIRYLGDILDVDQSADLMQKVDALVLAMSPNDTLWIGQKSQAELEADALAKTWPDVCIAQFCGAVDRRVIRESGLRAIPHVEPPPQHMGILPSDLGLVPMLRLQAGGLKVGELLARARLAGFSPQAAVESSVQAGYGQHLLRER